MTIATKPEAAEKPSLVDLEAPLCDAVLMAEIAMQLADDAGGNKVKGSDAYLLQGWEFERLLFAIHHAVDLAKEAKELWYAAAKAKGFDS